MLSKAIYPLFFDAMLECKSTKGSSIKKKGMAIFEQLWPIQITTKRIIGMLLLHILAACAGYDGRGLIPGEAGEEDVIRLMGSPAMRWANPDGSSQLAYPRGPANVDTYMVRIGPDGKLRRIENVLTPKVFRHVQSDMNTAEVLRLLGPPVPAWTSYFPARDELVWEWLYCDEWNELARFDVLFDGTKKTVRSTMTTKQDFCGHDQSACRCSH